MPDLTRATLALARTLVRSAALTILLFRPLCLMASGATCDAAADHAARATGVPVEVLQAVTRVETGRSRDGRVEPWPWAVNVAGKGYWFDNEDAALAFAFRQVKSGARNFDVGCFQVNYRWHGEAFASVEDMFDPRSNALYAAQFLTELHREFGEWEGAVGAYHSRTRKFADRYKARFRQIRAALDVPSMMPRGALRRRVSQGPGSLIGTRPDGRRSPGSLVALPGARTALISLD